MPTKQGGNSFSSKGRTAVAPLILSLRDLRVILDTDLTRLYGVETRALNQAIKRNQDRFPADFMFDLARAEILRISQTVTSLRWLRFSKQVRAFTEHGALMATMVLSSPRAVADHLATGYGQNKSAVITAFVSPGETELHYLWIQPFHSALNEKGRAGFVMANSASDARSSEQELRRQLIESRAVDCMVAVADTTETLADSLSAYARD